MLKKARPTSAMLRGDDFSRKRWTNIVHAIFLSEPLILGLRPNVLTFFGNETEKFFSCS